MSVSTIILLDGLASLTNTSITSCKIVMSFLCKEFSWHIIMCLQLLLVTIISSHKISVYKVEYLVKINKNKNWILWNSFVLLTIHGWWRTVNDKTSLYKFGYLIFISEDTAKMWMNCSNGDKDCVLYFWFCTWEVK